MSSLSEPDSTLQHPAHETHLFHMRLALAEAQQCIPLSSAYCVGAILVDPIETPYKIVTTGYSRELPGNTHAEQCCIEKFKGTLDTKNSSPESGFWLYTTMEPCSERLSGNKPCVDRIIEFGKISTVYVGVVEPKKFIQQNTAFQKLTENGVQYILVPGLENEIQTAALKGH